MITKKTKAYNTYLNPSTINDICLLQVAFGIENARKGVNKTPTKVEMEQAAWDFYMDKIGNALLKKHDLKK